jgi:(1->4)-alpha-D-glucan 1-alpha-D-glucosylmutase
MEQLFPGELAALSKQLAQLSRTATAETSLTAALIEVTANLPVYRTYIRDFKIPTRDRIYLETAFREAARRSPGVEMDFLRRVLFLDFYPGLNTEQKKAWLHFVLRWQQWTGAIMAKGFEDTTLYNYNYLVSLNEVGGNPDLKSVSPEIFHHFNKERRENWPHTLNTTSTHDTKRSEDVRARINVLSELSGEWREHAMRWHQWNQPMKRTVAGQPVPEPNMEYLLYQTMVGAWPLSAEDVPDFSMRLKEYAIKAVREAKVFTSWPSPNQPYEAALTVFLDNILDNSNIEFLNDFLNFQEKIAWYGALNSLGQVLLKITSPGVPDFYQGAELWDLSLVDPDNRRPVDFNRRMEMLDELIRREEAGEQSALAGQLFESWSDGRLKLYVTYRALNTRRSQPDLFRKGDYTPLLITGQQSAHICAFARRRDDTWTLTIVPRLLTSLVPPGRPPSGRQVWADDLIRLPAAAPEHWYNIFTGEGLSVTGPTGTLAIRNVLKSFPVALLTAKG